MFSEYKLNINSCLQITKPAYVHFSQIMPYRLRRSVLYKRNYRLKGWVIANLLCPVQHFLSQSPPCQAFANVNYSITLFFKIWGVRLVYQTERTCLIISTVDAERQILR